MPLSKQIQSESFLLMIGKKLLIAGGCSYTDGNYITNDKNLPQKRGAWKMWPEHLGNELNLDVINTGKSGSSNETIFHNVLEKIYLYGDRIDTVAIMWTGMDRLRFLCGYDINPLSEVNIVSDINPAYKDGKSPFEWMARLGMGNLSYNFFTSVDFWRVRTDFIKYSIEDSLRNYSALADICAINNIKFVFINGLLPFDYYYLSHFQKTGILKCPEGESVETYEKTVLKDYVNNVWFSKFDKNHKSNFIGWPIYAPLGGTYFDNMRDNNRKLFPKNNKYNVSDIDAHPNAEAQEIISKVILERHRKLYA